MDNKNFKTRYFKNVLFLIFFVFGVVVAFQMKSIKNSSAFYNSEMLKELNQHLEKEKKEYITLLEYKERKEEELSELLYIDDMAELELLLKNQIRDISMISQNTKFEGPGIEIKMRDSDIEISANQNPNDFIIHDQDMLRVVNDLKVAGAEIIAINNQIIGPTTEIKCSGATITVNGKTFAQPFVILAIGDTEILEAAIKSKDSYSYMISTTYGIKVETEIKEKIIIDATLNNKKIKYLEEVL